MGELWRSKSMSAVRLFMPRDVAFASVEELGKLGHIQFTDLNEHVNAFRRTYAAEVRRMDDMERTLRFLDAEVRREQFEHLFNPHGGDVHGSLDLMDLEHEFEEREAELRQVQQRQRALSADFYRLVELKFVLLKAAELFHQDTQVRKALNRAVNTDEDAIDEEAAVVRTGADVGLSGGGASSPPSKRSGATRSLLRRRLIPSRISLLSSGSGGPLDDVAKLGFISGVVDRRRMATFERVLWRALHGNLLIKQLPIDDVLVDPKSGDEIRKNVFVLFFQGTVSQQKIRNICESFNANIHPCPGDEHRRTTMLRDVEAQLRTLDDVLTKTSAHRRTVLADVFGHVDTWRALITKRKAVYTVLNKCDYDMGRSSLIAMGWCPSDKLDEVRDALQRGAQRAGATTPAILSVVRSQETPPTCFRLNTFTGSIHGLVASYGVPRYQEVNPAAFTTITFPFFFGVMFGDVTHGLMMVAFALLLLMFERRLKQRQNDEMFDMIFNARWLLLLMGLFAFYCGLVYNECISLPLELFDSSWKIVGSGHEMRYEFNGRVYPLGIDPAWRGSSNELEFANSIKKKLSILFGVAHMVLGIVVSAVNHRHNDDRLSLYFEFVPQMLMFLSTFGYLAFLIVFKWLWPGSMPSLMTIILNMFMSPFRCCPDGKQLYAGQPLVESLLFLVAVVCVPVMLLGKPLLLRRRNQAVQRNYALLKDRTDDERGDEAGDDALAPTLAFDFGEVMLHQSIHTIEFVIGALSNTTSYLRLWALSLAHGELSQVFWEHVMIGALRSGNQWAVMIGFSFWLAATVGVLMCMESLSAFLHALRLHWVEFQNKFFKGDGTEFAPFSFELVMASQAKREAAERAEWELKRM